MLSVYLQPTPCNKLLGSKPRGIRHKVMQAEDNAFQPLGSDSPGMELLVGSPRASIFTSAEKKLQ